VADQVRFVHAADIHLGAPFKGVDATDRRVRDALASSTYDALDRVVEVCIAREVDFLVLAGDVYNHAEKPLRAEFAFRAACERLQELGIEVFVARGNHDPARGFTAGLAMPGTVHYFSEHEVERFAHMKDGREVCALYGRSFRTSAETANLARGFARAAGDKLAIGVLHANVGGRADHEPYAPCSVDDLRAARMDYWALGHVHAPEIVAQDPPIAYAGCTQGLDPTQRGVRGCWAVTLSSDGADVEFVSTARVIWDHVSVRCDEAEGIDEVRAAVAGALDECRRDASGLPVVVRAEIAGRCGAHSALVRPGALRDLTAELRADGLDRDPWVWLDRLVDRTHPALDLAAIRNGQDFAGDLVRRADAVLSGEGAAAGYVEELARAALDTLDARDLPEIDAVSVVERARDLVLDRLFSAEER